MNVKPGVAAVLLTQAIGAVGNMAVMPVLPFFAVQSLGASALEVALLASCFNFAQMVFAPFIGAVSDHFGRKWVMLGGLLMQALSNLFQAEADSPAALLLARGFVGLATSTGPVEMAYIMDYTRDEQQLSYVLALQRVVCNGGALMGPVIAHSFASYGFPALCRGLACINLLCLLLGSILWDNRQSLPCDLDREACGSTPMSLASIPRSRSDLSKAGGRFMGDNHIAVLCHGGVCYLLGASFGFSFAMGLSEGPEPLFLKERYFFGQTEFGWYFMVSNASTLMWSPLLPMFIARFGARVACAGGCFGTASALIFLISLRGCRWAPYMYVAATVGLFSTMVGLGFMGLVSKNCPRHLLGTMLGLKNALDGMAGTAAPAVGGMLYYLGRLLPYAVACFFALAMAIFYISLEPSVSKKDMSEELKPLMPQRAKAEAEEEEVKVPLRHVQSSALPLSVYAGKSFSSQCLLNQLSLVMDPELRELYNMTKDRIEKEKGTVGASGIRSVATVSDGLCSRTQQISQSRSLGEVRWLSSDNALAGIATQGGEPSPDLHP
mmetsp:Transcript_3047/g.5356  ORF Transcript_3047/g.5356 Transcript_3047/m.5356 type:complete len:551 (+) Transcript_3047:160-1812(+)